ncbi:hypothetical protein KKP62_10300 [Rhodococcus sp. GOMB7]|uniref:hypothetical protein n=1 Tax=Rhodococcus sp. GOMB7 TaxID=2839033 RepID=UPI001BFFE0B8|nr:hypothetical protein [Rhodococcus sp. GOMB7]MBT9295353.1 hypothetical protein [Rhodococcus sp. GOMB7]
MSEIRSQATPARDELAAYLDRVIDNEAWANTGAEAAKHIEEVLGWSKPRTVNSATELDALPVGSVLARNLDHPDEMDVYVKRSDTAGWRYLPLPMTVLFTPGEAG